MRIAPQLVLTSELRAKLEACARGRRTSARVVLRARIVLLGAEGKQDMWIARLLGIMPHTAARSRSRFLRGGIAGLEHDAPRPGRSLPSHRNSRAWRLPRPHGKDLLPQPTGAFAPSLIPKNRIANPNPLFRPQRPMTFSKRLNAPRPTSITANPCDAVEESGTRKPTRELFRYGKGESRVVNFIRDASK